jgi:glucosamine 6-phosphate synthetase-like amidotransferase/phosphosugar isomerase protein
MCGICGVYNPCQINKQDIKFFSVLLHRSEVRGKDATGIYTQNVLIKKDVVPVEFLKENASNLLKEENKSFYMIGHTRRWTRGRPSVNRNNHPLPSEHGNGFAVTHNGVVYLSDYGRDSGLEDEPEFVDSRLIVKALDICWDLEKDILDVVNESFRYHRGRATVAIGLANGELILVSKNNPLFYYRKEKGEPIYYAQEITFFPKDLDRKYIKKVRNNVMIRIKIDGDMIFKDLGEESCEALIYARYNSCSTYRTPPRSTKKYSTTSKSLNSYMHTPKKPETFHIPNKQDRAKPVAICDECNTSWFLDDTDVVKCPTCGNTKKNNKKQNKKAEVVNLNEMYAKVEKEKGIKKSSKQKKKNLEARERRNVSTLPRNLQEVAVTVENQLDTMDHAPILRTVSKRDRRKLQDWYYKSFKRVR